MRKFVLAGGCLLSLGAGVVSASAADLGPRRAAPLPAVAPVYNWNGFYIGINGGGGWGNSNFAPPFASGSFNTSGGLIGGTIGYNLQTGPAVFGIEGDIDWSNIRGSGICGVATSCSVQNNWLGTVRGRLGYAMDRFLPYVTGGLALGDIGTSIAGVGSANSTKAGWTVGGGLEAALWGRFTGKIEYLYVDLGRGGSILGSDARFNAHTVRAGLNYRF